jgi:hypothetical protein
MTLMDVLCLYFTCIGKVFKESSWRWERHERGEYGVALGRFRHPDTVERKKGMNNRAGNKRARACVERKRARGADRHG